MSRRVQGLYLSITGVLTTCRALRWVTGVAGVSVVALSFKWMDWLGVPYDLVPAMLRGIVTFLGMMLGVYLLFYALTGDWLPKLSKSTGRR